MYPLQNQNHFHHRLRIALDAVRQHHIRPHPVAHCFAVLLFQIQLAISYTVLAAYLGAGLRHLDREIAAFADRPSTAENIIVYLWNELAPKLNGRLALLRLWETRKNIFSYAGPLSVPA